MKKFSVLFAILVFSASAFGQTRYKTYSNSRFVFSISYPSNSVMPKNEWSSTYSGETFLSKDKGVEMRVWGEYNSALFTLKEKYEDCLNDYGNEITYKVLLKSGFVISGIKDDKIFYQKALYHKFKNTDVFYIFTIEYKKSNRKKFDKIVQKIAKSFKFDQKANV